MKSAGNGGILNGGLQVLHIHVLFVALMLVCARLRHVAGSQWGNKKYMNMKHLEAAIEDASIAG